MSETSRQKPFPTDTKKMRLIVGRKLLMPPNVGKVQSVKKLVCYLLIVWMALMSGGANAHMFSVDHHLHDRHSVAIHDHNHDHDHAPEAEANTTSTLADGSKLDANNAEILTQAHYGHGHSHNHAAGLPASCDLHAAVKSPSLKPVAYLPIVISAITNNIERPKWLVTTPAVVSLLS